MIMGFPFWRLTNIFIDNVIWEHDTLSARFLDVSKFTDLTPLSLLISCKLSFLFLGLRMSSLPTLALKSPYKEHH
jgi:hypothetical protein